MAPKSKKKAKKFNADDDDVDDIKLGDIPEPAVTAAEPKSKAPKQKKGKKKPVAGDWSDDEAAQVPLTEALGKEDEPPVLREAPAPASAFALLQADDEDEDEKTGEGKEQNSADGESEADEHRASVANESKGIVCAEVTHIAKHPNADRLKVCQLDAGSTSIQVVTNAQNVTEGMRTALALEGSQTPGSDIAVAAATVRGSRSFGMICSAQDLGWMEAGNGLAVKLPQGMELGTVLGPDVPKGADLGAEKGDKLEASQAAKKSGKKKGDKAVKDEDAASAFSALRLEDEEDQQLDAEEISTGGQNDGVPSTAAPKQNGSTSGQEAEQIELAAMKTKLGKKKKGKVDVGDAFAALGLDDGGKAEETFSATNGDIASENANGHLAGTDTSQAQQEGTEDKILLSNLNGKKKQKKKSSADIDALLASMGEEPSRQDTQSGVGEADEAQAIKQTQKKKRREGRLGGDVDAMLAQLGGTAPQKAGEAPQPEAGEVLQQADEQEHPASKADQVENKTEDVSKGADDDDVETHLAATAESSKSIKAEQPSNDTEAAETAAELPMPSSAADETPAGKAQKQKKKKKGKQDKQQDDDDLEAILAELDGKPQPAQAPGSMDSAAAPASAESVPTEPPAEDAENTAELSAAAKKKLKKKAKEKAKKSGGAAADEPAEADEEQAAVAAPAPKKGGKKVSAAVRRMQEALERQEREAEEAVQMEAERRAAEEESARKAAEEEARLAIEREQRKADRAARRAEAKRQGLLLTGKAKRDAERLAVQREQLLRNAGGDISGASPRDVAGKAGPKKVVYGKKKNARKEAAPTDAASRAAEEEADALAEREAAEEAANQAQSDAQKAAEAERAQQVEAPSTAAETTPEESEEDIDWENMDLDAVKLPGTKKEEPPATEAVKRPPAEDIRAADASAAVAKKQRHGAVAVASKRRRRVIPEAVKRRHGAVAVAKEPEDEEDEDDSSLSSSSSSESDETDEDSEELGADDLSQEESSDEDSSSSDSSSDSSSESSSADSEEEREERLARQKQLREARLKAAMESGSKDHLRSPICCILGHVDTGKTKLLDNVRRTSVQEGEAGGITQQIGATYVPGEAIANRTESLRKGKELEMKMPGLLIIDTPGHESFTNLRSRGSGLCDIAILVVDLMHGLEPQTVESIELLKMRKTPFIIAVNKVDRLYAWKSTKDAPMKESLAGQSEHTMSEFRDRMKKCTLDLNEQGLNVALYWENPDIRKYVNIVPTSAITGEGIPDLLQLLVKLTQAMMAQRLMFISELQCTVLEVKVIEGLGTTIDVVLVNGMLHEGDQIVVCGLNGPIVTNIRSLLTPHPLKELRVKGSYVHHKEIRAAQGVKLAGPGLESAVAGTQLLVVGPDDDVSLLKEEVMQDMESIFDSVDRSGEGVCVQASTLGSLEALLEFLRSQKEPIPVSSIAIGPIHRKDVMRAKVMLEKGCKKFGIILAFDVPVTREAQELADKEGVRIMRADIIYHLFDQFTAYCKEVKEHEQEAAKLEAVFPCILRILPTCVFNKKDPIVVGADIVEGIAKVGTPLCIPSQDGMDIGRIASMEINHVAVNKAKRGDSIALKVEATNTAESSRLYGRHFDHKDDLVSRISRKSINLLKQHFKDELSKDEWRLVVRLKKVFNID